MPELPDVEGFRAVLAGLGTGRRDDIAAVARQVAIGRADQEPQ